MVRAIIFASALVIGSAALAQDAAPPADNPPAADAAPAASAAPAADNAATYPACSATVQDHCIQGQHGARHKPAKRTHHKAHG